MFPCLDGPTASPILLLPGPTKSWIVEHFIKENFSKERIQISFTEPQLRGFVCKRPFWPKQRYPGPGPTILGCSAIGWSDVELLVNLENGHKAVVQVNFQKFDLGLIKRVLSKNIYKKRKYETIICFLFYFKIFKWAKLVQAGQRKNYKFCRVSIQFQL